MVPLLHPSYLKIDKQNNDWSLPLKSSKKFPNGIDPLKVYHIGDIIVQNQT